MPSKGSYHRSLQKTLRLISDKVLSWAKGSFSDISLRDGHQDAGEGGRMLGQLGHPRQSLE